MIKYCDYRDRSKSGSLVLGNLSPEELLILGENGLSETHPQPFAEYEKRVKTEEENRTRIYNDEVKTVEEQVGRDRPKLKQLVIHTIRSVYNEIYP